MSINFKGFRVIYVIAAFLMSAVPVFAMNQDQAMVGSISGQAEFQKAGSADWQKLEMDAILSEGDSIKTAPGSEVTLTLMGAAKTAEIVVRESSQFVFKTFQHDDAAIDTTLLDVSLGAVLVKAEKLAGDSRFEVKTPTSIVGIRGTMFEVKVGS